MQRIPAHILQSSDGDTASHVGSDFDKVMLATQFYPKLLKSTDIADIDQNAFVFIDASGFTNRSLLSTCLQLSISTSNISVFNLSDVDNNIANQLLQLRVQGVFYETDPDDIIVKGLNKIKMGELWFKRKTLEESIRFLQRSLSKQVVKKEPEKSLQNDNIYLQALNEQTLTKREVSIVTLVSQGAQNKEIADALNISINTVKTHIYSIFRKTNCRNRVELMSWSLNKVPNFSD